MNALVATKRSDLPELLAPFAGGFFFGLLRYGDQLRALIVSPKAEGDLGPAEWGEFGKEIEAAASCFDGLANTEAMAAAGSAIAQSIRALRIGGHDDWHIPARDALELMYRHGKPTDDENWASFRDGDNPSSEPPGYPYTEASPVQCANTLFQVGGAEAFEAARYWSSTQCSAHGAWMQDFGVGYQDYSIKDDKYRVRAVRTIPVSH